MGWVELKITNRGEILAKLRGHERWSVIGCHVFERVHVQRGTAMHVALTKGMVQVGYKKSVLNGQLLLQKHSLGAH